MTKNDMALATPRISDRSIALVGIFGVAAYVATWFIVGITRSGYVPTQQAISELFELGAPTTGRVALSLALAVTGLLLIPFGRMLHRQLHGASRLGPWLI
ncbi:MAG: putative membrane protein, partial [Glaciecola sp.]